MLSAAPLSVTPATAVECTRWAAMRDEQPFCDAPDDTTSRYAIDLDSTFGPRCSLESLPDQSCCYVPLGYGGGPAFGSSCREACDTYLRIGDDSAYCAQSTGEDYGNCYCGPRLLKQPPPPPPAPLDYGCPQGKYCFKRFACRGCDCRAVAGETSDAPDSNMECDKSGTCRLEETALCDTHNICASNVTICPKKAASPPPPTLTCTRWKTLRETYPFCDPPMSSDAGRYEVDLSKELGHVCGSGLVSDQSCCYYPLGGSSAHLPSANFGTGCSQVCAGIGRQGADDAWCQRSDKSDMGDCFCGPKE